MLRDASWADLLAQCQSCQGCALGNGCGQKVFGQGNPQAKVLVIAPCPTLADWKKGQLLSGAEGKLFWDLLSLGNITPEQLYLSSVVKCPPPQNRGTLHIERHTCLNWLRAQTKLLRPQVIVCLGQETMTEIMGAELNLETHHGQWFVRRGVEMMAMHHPKDLLAQGDLRPQGFLAIKSLEKKLQQLGL